ncbi:cytochrome o ubiquinol oxidase subunit II [Serratia liquefaciens]|jgi:cytochrome o ubiquinol oxidase subunit 2|uniref:Ubiquinol oxidase subunit 2 n=1 Tax=Serratia liquefaciens TaxID=614 RepID=A0A515CZG2_SERLI|nr:cytochrome o ubiquinol oxidase subunit II [Serratia liquefaciens]MBV0840517.1 cytochrome o ubiquinol oxidase subunit II [Serratia liquefaciens]QDL33534.1 cytochrome o ubiquinol oxidase subunit II [Serratia liquefaciens]QQU54406.1 cytochrome o ubiquinol oxidase subunit II [Serratia liquefaciens]CAI0711656.1 Ubiquinol oxidase subunit 2 precursor [Serratia liquefaciens]HCR61459.1 cytochrome o ubiquinol oxidase subunit II [Serratia liquefaciens]
MRLKKYNKSIGMLSLIASTVMLSGCNMVLMNPKGAIGVEQRTLIITAIALMLIVVIPVIFMAFAFAWKYRASNKDAKYSPNWSHSNKIEAVVWTIPIIIIAILGTITWKTTHELDPFKPIVTDKKPMTIEVVSLDWKWLFIYPEQGIATVNELAFPKDVPVEFKITSNSVMNSFFIPQLGGQIYAMAGMQTKLHLIGNEAGKYDGISSSFSGRGFSGMKFTAIVTPTEGDFDQWVAKVKASSNNLNATSDFNKLAEPSENNPVEYFSSVKPNLFKETIGKFMGDMDMHKGASAHEGMDMSQGMDMGEHAHAGAEE